MRRPIRVPIVLACAAMAGALALPGTATAGPAGPPRYVEALFLLHHPSGLNRFVRSVSDPGSPSYRRYASVEKLVKRFGAPPKQRRATLRWLAAQGLRGQVGPTGTYVLARVSSGVAARGTNRAAVPLFR